MEKVFEPDSIAVIGASERKGSVGAAIMRNLIQGGYRGRIYPVNPNYRKLWDFKALPSLDKIDSKIDLVVIAVPIQDVPNWRSWQRIGRIHQKRSKRFRSPNHWAQLHWYN
jgi:acetyltransferase